jgi:hypothetical protein
MDLANIVKELTLTLQVVPQLVNQVAAFWAALRDEHPQAMPGDAVLVGQMEQAIKTARVQRRRHQAARHRCEDDGA